MRMGVERYAVLRAYAGSNVGPAHPQPYLIEEAERGARQANVIPGCVGVYIACSGDQMALYVGSVYRPSDPLGIASRVSEHRRVRGRADAWVWLWVVELLPTSNEQSVRQVENRIGFHLSPLQNKALPTAQARVLFLQ
jgi:hypothetical protein